MARSITVWPSIAALAVGLTGCGGGSGGGIVSLPAPIVPPSPPAPTPASTPVALGATDKIIGGAKTSQAFATHDYAPGWAGGLEISYDAPSGTYLVASPAEAPATPLLRSSNYKPLSGSPWQDFVTSGGMHLLTHVSADFTDPDIRYSYSNLASWNYQVGAVGYTAFGMATPATNVPRTGAGTYSGFIAGGTQEKCLCGWDGELVTGWLSGTVKLDLDFAAASLSGYVAPVLELSKSHDLGQLLLSDASWAPGSPTFRSNFSGTDVSNASLVGTLTGPAAEEMIGRLTFNYLSPVDHTSQSAGGAFIAKR